VRLLSDSFITSAFIIESVVEMIQLQGCISEVEFVHTAEMGGYANMSLNIPKLCEIALQRRK
jgi:hypothetical protein